MQKYFVLSCEQSSKTLIAMLFGLAIVILSGCAEVLPKSRSLSKDNEKVVYASKIDNGLTNDDELNQSTKMEASEDIRRNSPPIFEGYVGVFKGISNVADAQVMASYSCFLCTTTTASQTIHFDKGSTAGIRVGFWGENFGFAFDNSVMHASNTGQKNVPQVSVGYEYESFIPMVRATFFKTESMPGGHLNIYLGLGISGYGTGNIDVTIPPNPPISASAKDKGGTIALIGVSYRYSHAIFFLEFRATDITISSDNWAPGNNATIPIRSNDTVLGTAYRF
jgi:hypothetical protein